MKTSTLVAVLIAILIVIAGFWYVTQPASAPTTPAGGTATTATTTSTAPAQGNSSGAAPAEVLGLNTSSSLGSYLTAENGMTLYTYSPDKPGVSNCTGGCAANWPPYTVASQSDINIPATLSGTVSAITRADGTLQVTYNGMPLYLYIQDSKSGDTNGQGVGGVWFVAKP